MLSLPRRSGLAVLVVQDVLLFIYIEKFFFELNLFEIGPKDHTPCTQISLRSYNVAMEQEETEEFLKLVLYTTHESKVVSLRLCD